MNHLSKYRLAAGLTQKELGELASMKQPSIQAIEKGGGVHLGNARAIVSALNTRLTEGAQCTIDDVFPPSSSSAEAA